MCHLVIQRKSRATLATSAPAQHARQRVPHDDSTHDPIDPLAGWHPVDRALAHLTAAAVEAMQHAPDAAHKMAIWRAAEALARTIDGAVDGDPEAVTALGKMTLAGESTASMYRLAEELCTRWVAGENVAPRPMHVGATEGERRANDLREALRWRVDDRFGGLPCGTVPEHKDAPDLAVKLTVAANAIGPREKGESAQKHARRIRKAFVNARHKGSPEIRKRPRRR